MILFFIFHFKCPFDFASKEFYFCIAPIHFFINEYETGADI